VNCCWAKQQVSSVLVSCRVSLVKVKVGKLSNMRYLCGHSIQFLPIIW